MHSRHIAPVCFLVSCSPVKSVVTSSPSLHVNSLVRSDQEFLLKGLVEKPTANGFRNLVVFGDSLSDPGNLHRKTLGFFLPTNIFYGARFSNGPIWTDYVAASLNWKVINYAVGGAKTTGFSLLDRFVSTPLDRQIEEHLRELKGLPKESTVVVIWVGSNNYTFETAKFQDAQKKLEKEKLRKHAEDSILDIRNSISTMKGLGFKNFLLGSIPELGVLIDNPKDPRLATPETLFAATAAHNHALENLLADFQKQSDIVVGKFSSGEINQQTIENPQKWGFRRLDVPCYVGSLRGEFYGPKEFCADPAGHKFWEFTHPNSKMHCYYASQFLSDLARINIIPTFPFETSTALCKSL